MVTTEELDATFQKVGNDFGYEARAEFKAFCNLKVKWIRTYQMAEFSVSDYLEDAPLEIIEDIARTIFSKINGIESEYSPETIEWFTSDDFVDRHQDEYIRRDSRIDDAGAKVKNVAKALERLDDLGFDIGELDKVKILWTREPDLGETGFSSLLMRTIVLNRILDSEDIPDNVFDLVLLRHILNIRSDFSVCNADRKRIIDETIGRYPGFDGIVEWLNSRGLTL